MEMRGRAVSMKGWESKNRGNIMYYTDQRSSNIKYMKRHIFSHAFKSPTPD